MEKIVKRKSLKEKLDEIDNCIYRDLFGNYYKSRLKILISLWEKGKAIGEFRGVKSPKSYRQLGKDTGRNHESLKKWHDIYKEYPDKKKYIKESAEPDAKNWTDKALGQGKQSVHFLSESSEWTTPKLIINKSLELLGEIDLDPCSNPDFPNVPAKIFFDEKTNGLKKDWFGKIYMNPPYGNIIKKWIEKVCSEHEKSNIKEAIVLVPSRTDAQWFMRMKNYPRCFIWGRLKFGESENSAPFPSMIVYLGERKKDFIKIFSDIGDIYEWCK